MNPSRDDSPQWSWETNECYRPEYTAYASATGIAYGVMMGGPSGGGGMAGYQTYEQFLAEGPINLMPASVEAELRAHAHRLLLGHGRAQLRWELGIDAHAVSAGAELAYVSAAVNHTTIAVRTLEEDHTVLFEGSIAADVVQLSLLVGYGRPWRRPGARMAEHSITLELSAGRRTIVSCAVLSDLSLAQTYVRHPVS